MAEELNTEFLFPWSEEFSVGIDEVDAQHKNLVGFVNELHSAIKNKKGRAASLEIIARLIDYTQTHFAFEEALMRTTNYPDYKVHKEQHADLVEKVSKLQEKLINENAAITFSLLHFLKSWLSIHICEDDMNFGHFFQQANLGLTIHANQPKPESKKPWWKFW